MRGRTFPVVLAGIVLVCSVVTVRAATRGLWLYEDLYDATPGDPNPAGGITTSDSSGNHLDFVTATEYGTLGLTSDRPAVMPAGTTAMESYSGGARGMATPASALLSVGNTGQLSVEFWFKSLRPPPSYGYILSWGVNDSTAGDWSFYTNGFNSTVRASFAPNSGFPEVAFANVLDGNWHHLAATVIAGGAFNAYVDGALADSKTIGAFPAAAAHPLRFGATSGWTFGDQDFIIDELRISDVALLPGNGTGVNELAWNASLVPEPGTMLGLAGLAALAGLRRRR